MVVEVGVEQVHFPTMWLLERVLSLQADRPVFKSSALVLTSFVTWGILAWALEDKDKGLLRGLNLVINHNKWLFPSFLVSWREPILNPNCIILLNFHGEKSCLGWDAKRIYCLLLPEQLPLNSVIFEQLHHCFISDMGHKSGWSCFRGFHKVFITLSSWADTSYKTYLGKEMLHKLLTWAWQDLILVDADGLSYFLAVGLRPPWFLARAALSKRVLITQWVGSIRLSKWKRAGENEQDISQSLL